MSMWLWRELAAERARNAELNARVDFATPLPVVVPEPTALPESAPVNPSPAAAIPAAEATATSSPGHVYGTQEDMDAYQHRMLQQPKYREAWRAQQRLDYGRRRENLIRLLGFTPEEADAAVEIAIDRLLSLYERAPPNPVTDEYHQQRQALYEQGERDDQAKLHALLGDEKHARFQGYMESRATRIQVDELRPQFTGADALRDDQVEPLIAALHAERAQMQRQLSEDRERASPDGKHARQPFYERQFELLKEAYGRMHSAAAPVLSPSQLERLDALLKREIERREAEIRLQRVQMKSN